MAIKQGNRTLTARQQAELVRKWTGWSAKEYQKEYDKLRNKTRNYERINGFERGSINVADLLARNARNRYYAPRYGEEARNTNLYNAIQRTTSASTGARLSQRTIERARNVAIQGVEKQFAGALSKSTAVKLAVEALKRNNPNYTAKELQDEIKNTLALAQEAGRTYNVYREAQAEQGVILPKRPDTL